jgi:uncharacterized oligopeptide transporter (OPT) family protein
MDDLPVATMRGSSLATIKEAMTLRAVTCAVFLGSGVCLANMYFGLQAGLITSMPMQSALLGFAIFRSLPRRLHAPLSPVELTVVELMAGAIGFAPFTSGCTSFIPALEYLTTPEESGPLSFSLESLLLWAIATCTLGLIAGAPFRNHFILREQLRYPSGTATGTLIGVLFRRADITARAHVIDKSVTTPTRSLEINAEPHSSESETDGSIPSTESDLGRSSNEPSQRSASEIDGPGIRVLVYAFAGSAAFVGCSIPTEPVPNANGTYGRASLPTSCRF